ncbi:MAG: tRNA (adenosine(37)-N6)-threonylcarbamoyltransferase complex ATPase subunit type 1 TsaE [Candidatus Dormibacteraeota bacterium]|nr:tRNA (adenosine(37)-N6)-threonylcarbamoyltransferase complex ATPase subunit type 1 TsaE [Candidatus Dormibacteraeota bacterium]
MTSATLRLHTESPEETERLGAALGTVLRPGDVLVLEGPLGAGKTCLVRGLVDGAGGDRGAVRSPTFVLHQPHRAAGLTVHHIDLYRLGPGASIEVLDLDTLLLDGAVVIEWGGYADLSSFDVSTVSIAGGDRGESQRDFRLKQPAAAHLAEAWASLSRGAAAP